MSEAHYNLVLQEEAMRHPDCTEDPSECRISSFGGTRTLMAWTPTYDGNGKPVGRGDPNIVTQSYSCEKCGRKWMTSTSFGETKVIHSDRST